MRVVSPRFGFSAIAIHEPAWLLSNNWFAGTIPRKFVQHTGTRQQAISLADEVTMAVQATKRPQRDTGCDLRNCVAVVFVSPSFVPVVAARKYPEQERAREESVLRAAQQFAGRLEMSACRVFGINWFCAGYVKVLSILCRSKLNLAHGKFALVVTASRISRITDFECKQAGALFGDIATATLGSDSDGQRYPVRFDVLSADAETQTAGGVFFDFHLRENVLAPSPERGKTRVPPRLVFSLDGLGIADAAPRAMSAVLYKSLATTGIVPTKYVSLYLTRPVRPSRGSRP